MTGTGYQVGPPPSALGRSVAICVTFIGLLEVAFLTATLCSFSDLDSAELWLIRILERKRLVHMQRVSATLLVQRAFRLMAAGGALRRTKRAELASSSTGKWGNLANGTHFTASRIRHLGNWVAHAFSDNSHNRRVSQAIRRFRKYRIMNEEARSVVNLKVVHGMMDHLQTALECSLVKQAEELDAIREKQADQSVTLKQLVESMNVLLQVHGSRGASSQAMIGDDMEKAVSQATLRGPFAHLHDASALAASSTVGHVVMDAADNVDGTAPVSVAAISSSAMEAEEAYEGLPVDSARPSQAQWLAKTVESTGV